MVEIIIVALALLVGIAIGEEKNLFKSISTEKGIAFAIGYCTAKNTYNRLRLLVKNRFFYLQKRRTKDNYQLQSWNTKL